MKLEKNENKKIKNLTLNLTTWMLFMATEGRLQWSCRAMVMQTNSKRMRAEGFRRVPELWGS